MRNVTVDDACRMIEATNSLYKGIQELLKDYGDRLAPGSQAEEEKRIVELNLSLETAYTHGGTLITVAADHIFAFTRLMEQPVPTLAPWTCVRGVLESSALAAWLLDPSLGARTRVQRSFALRYRSLRQQEKFAHSMDDQDPMKRSSIKRSKQVMDRVENDALALGFEPVRIKKGKHKGKRNGIGQKMPTMTKVIIQTLDAESKYRLLSAMAHAEYWAFQQLGFRKIGDDTSVQDEDDTWSKRVYLLTQEIAPQSVVSLSMMAVESLVKPIRCKSELFGWETTRIDDIFWSFLRTAAGVYGHQLPISRL